MTEHLRWIAEREMIPIQDAALVAISRLCEGGLRDALQLLAQVRLLGETVSASQVIELAGGIAEADLLTVLQAISTNDTFQLLQTARKLMDAGKSPKLILSSLLQTYRDLLIVQSVPNQRHLLTSSVGADHLQAIAQRWSHETIQTGLAQLHTSEGHLRYSSNGQVWLEVCLLNLMPKLTHQFSMNSTIQTSSIHHSNGKTQASAKHLWQQVVEKAPDSARKLLSKAKMESFDGHHAILVVEARYLEKFEKNATKIAQMIQRVAGGNQPLQLKFETELVRH
jgi:DNA polymerase-3 subunit gamma/tau